MAAPIVEDDSVATLVGRLIEDGRELVGAEMGLYRAKLGERVSAYKSAVVFFAVAGVLALAALIALLVGLILWLATLVGPLGSTAIVVAVVLAVAGVMAMIGKGKLRQPILPEVTA